MGNGYRGVTNFGIRIAEGSLVVSHGLTSKQPVSGA
jgi:hypothetical protein